MALVKEFHLEERQLQAIRYIVSNIKSTRGYLRRKITQKIYEKWGCVNIGRLHKC